MADLTDVRLLIADVDYGNLLFTDQQILRFLALEGGIWSAAALALETMAVSEVLISKKIRTQDLATDGPAVAAELRTRAKELRAMAEDGEGYIGFGSPPCNGWY